MPLNGSVFWILSAYLLVTLGVGWWARDRSRNQTAEQYLNAGRSLPLPIVVLAYVAANCGALELVGLSAMAAQYGVQAFHFYWVGAIPAMIFLALLMMPVYRRSGVRSVPEYLLLRFGQRLRLLNASATALVLLLLSGVSLYAMAQVLEAVLGLRFSVGVCCSAAVVLLYVFVGGIRATIYNEVLQLLVMVAGLLPLALLTARSATPTHLQRAGSRAHLWQALPLVSPHASLDMVGVVLGLGFVLSFGYWCTDFVLMQRAFTARSDLAARQVPLWAGFGKLAFSLIVVLPGLASLALLPSLGHGQRFDQALPALMQQFYGTKMLGLGLTALAASLMSGLAANVTAFAAIWTEDIYREVFAPGRRERHYVAVGRVAIVAAVAASILLSYLNFLFADLMEHVQLIFSVFGSPFWAIFLLGMSTRRADERGSIVGFLAGAGLSFLHSIAFRCGLLPYGSTMTANFYAAILAFLTALTVGWLASGRDGVQAQPALVFQRSDLSLGSVPKPIWVLSGALLAACALLNFVWR